MPRRIIRAFGKNPGPRMFKGIDFLSDTQTRPTEAMKRAMMSAEVGDEQENEDPTTLKLEEKTAQLLGHSGAMFFPTASMANQVALRLLSSPGDELVAAHNCHLFFAETGGPAIHSGLMLKPIPTTDGTFTGEEVRKHFRWGTGPHYPETRLLSVENTTNMGGGVAWSREKLDSVTEAAKALGLKMHLDGARLFNAAIASGMSAKEIAGRFDTATICLSKGLGCATGAVLVFDKAHWTKVRRLKQLMGGALRQSGYLAAAGIYALDNHLSRLAEDHKNAARLAELLSQDVPHVTVETLKPSTNMVYFHWTSKTVPTETFLKECEKKGVRFGEVEPTRIRAVTHLDISSADIEKAAQVVREVSRSF